MTNTRQRILITAGPTHEPIDAVRYIGNRSSGRLGLALAAAASQAGHEVTLLLGPTCLTWDNTAYHVELFRTTEDLARSLDAWWPAHDGLIMAAAVADYQPRDRARPETKRRRGDAFTLELVPTPDLLARAAAQRSASQWLLGFALEPRETMTAAGGAKLIRKNIDAIVINPLETMHADRIDATVLRRDGITMAPAGEMDKVDFARWLVAEVVPVLAAPQDPA